MKPVALAVGLLVVGGLSSAAYSENTNVSADNTKQNVRDRNGMEPTAQSQSSAKNALERTSELRRELMAQKGLSVNAQNIKIIDENGCMTLRGPVDSVYEKKLINRLAEQCFGIDFINQLEVRTHK